MTSRGRRFLLSLLFLVLLGAPAAALAASVALNVEVPAGQWRATGLRHLPKDAVVMIEVEASGEVGVAVIGARGLSRLPALEGALFASRGDADVSFSITTPAAGDYYLVLDNRGGQEARRAAVKVTATRDGRGGTAEIALTAFDDRLRRLFVFKPFPIRVKRCGKATAFAGPSGIVLCAEYAEHLAKTLGDKAKASDAILFTLFHELGHVLLAQWRYPSYDSEEVADEFAVALMVMLGQKHRVRAKAEFFAANPSAAEAIARLFRDDRHPLSAQRARNIIRAADNPNLVRKWQPVFVPRMQTAVLRKLQAQAPPWLDADLVERELATRR